MLRAHLAVKSDLVLALAVNIINLTPGTIVLEIDQARRMIYVHVLDVGSDRTVKRFYRQIIGAAEAAGRVVRTRRRLAAVGGEGGAIPHEHGLGHRRGDAGGRGRRHDVPDACWARRTLDRLVALDTLVAVTMCAIGTWAAFSLDTTVTYSLTALALIAFVGSVSVARFRVPDIADLTDGGPGQ